jgi:hypothetical protein
VQKDCIYKEGINDHRNARHPLLSINFYQSSLSPEYNDNEFGEQDIQYTEPSERYLVCGFEIGQCSSYGVEENLSVSINLEFRMRGFAQPKFRGPNAMLFMPQV